MGLNVVTDSLTWERVFNGDLSPLATLADSQLTATLGGYSFMAFEGLLYVTDRHTGVWSLAPQSANMLAEGSASVVALRETIRKRTEKIDEMSRAAERLQEALDRTIRRAADAEDRGERQGRIIADLRGAAETRVRTDSGRSEAARGGLDRGGGLVGVGDVGRRHAGA